MLRNHLDNKGVILKDTPDFPNSISEKKLIDFIDEANSRNEAFQEKYKKELFTSDLITERLDSTPI